MRLIDADALQTAMVGEYNKISGYKTREKFYRAIEIVRQQPTIATPPNDPLTLKELREMADEIADDFINYVTGGVQNAAPYCANMCSECCERPGWCTGYAKACKGFYPKAYRRKPEEETT